MTNRLLTLLETEQTRRYYAEGWWRTDTLHARFSETVALSPNSPAVVEGTRTVSYAALSDAVERVASHLRARGLRSGDRVAVWLPSRAEVAAVVLACARDGLVCSPSLHRDHTVGEVVALLGRMRARAFVGQVGYGADADRYDVFDRLAEVDTVEVVLAVDEADDRGTTMFPALPATATPGRPPATDPDAVVYLAFTSGSTGQPKGVMHSSNTLLAPVRAMAQDWDLGEGSVIYSMSPLSHNLGFGAMLLAVCGGGTLVAHDLARGASVAARMRTTRATFAFGVPTHAVDLVAELDRGEVPDLPDLKGFRVSGAAISAEVAERMLAHGLRPQSGYGMTEAGSHHYTRPADPTDLVVGSSGRPFLGHEACVVDRNDVSEVLPPGEVGQILGRGPSLMLGYFDDQRATEESLTEAGWLLTGDLGWLDADGNIRVTGRKKDVIIRGGHNIFPARIEGLVAGHPSVGKAAAIPVPDERLGERVCLVVARSGIEEPIPETLLCYLDAAGLSKYDMPERLAVVDEIPLLPSGKLDKRSLVDRVADGSLVPSIVRFAPADPTTRK